MTKSIFISHSSKDETLVDALVNILLDNGCQIERADVYCSSLEGLKTLPGEPNFIRALQDRMQSAKLIILLLSPNYYDSQYCLAELGATWMLKTLAFPIVVPPLKLGEIKGILQVAQVGSIDDERHLDRLRDDVLAACGVPHRSTDNWSRQRVTFVDRLKTILNTLPQPQRISPDDLNHALERADIYKLERDEAQNEIIRLNQVVEALKLAKDASEVSTIILKGLPEQKQFEKLALDVRLRFTAMSYVVKQAVYYDAKGEELLIGISDNTEDADRCVDEGYLIQGEGRFYSPNPNDRRIRQIQEGVQNIGAFIDEASDEFRDAFYEEIGYELSLNNLRFWKKFFW